MKIHIPKNAKKDARIEFFELVFNIMQMQHKMIQTTLIKCEENITENAWGA